ncbi:hypothetical protein GCM10022205_31540 [Spinactinospora alkalitolerans]
MPILRHYREPPRLRIRPGITSISRSACHRYIDVLAAQCPDVRETREAVRECGDHLILDGEFFGTDRCHSTRQNLMERLGAVGLPPQGSAPGAR